MKRAITLVYCLHACCLITVAGIVIRTTTVKMLETQKTFMCSKCNQKFVVEGEFEQCYVVTKPVRYFVPKPNSV